MLSISRAVEFIESRGSSIEIARMNSILGSKIDNGKALSQIRQLQNADGGFSLQVGAKSSISDTGFVIMWLSDLKLLQLGIAKQAIKYLESEQNNDGS